MITDHCTCSLWDILCMYFDFFIAYPAVTVIRSKGCCGNSSTMLGIGKLLVCTRDDLCTWIWKLPAETHRLLRYIHDTHHPCPRGHGRSLPREINPRAPRLSFHTDSQLTSSRQLPPYLPIIDHQWTVAWPARVCLVTSSAKLYMRTDNLDRLLALGR